MPRTSMRIAGWLRCGPGPHDTVAREPRLAGGVAMPVKFVRTAIAALVRRLDAGRPARMPPQFRMQWNSGRLSRALKIPEEQILGYFRDGAHAPFLVGGRLVQEHPGWGPGGGGPCSAMARIRTRRRRSMPPGRAVRARSGPASCRASPCPTTTSRMRMRRSRRPANSIPPRARPA